MAEEDGGHARGNVGDHWYKYRDGVIRNGLCVMTYNLADAPEGAGGFACIPASHKSNFAPEIPRDVRSFERSAHYVVQPALEAGDVLFFTEALIHGTMPWKAGHQRRALLYKYSPGHSSWSSNYYDISKYDGLTEQQNVYFCHHPSVEDRQFLTQIDIQHFYIRNILRNS